MTDTQRTKDPVALDDLKRAIAAYEKLSADPGGQMSLCQSKRAEAWRAAFEWREAWHARMVAAGGVVRIAVSNELLGSVTAIALLAESDEGMNLIREKLQ